jgi:hypothetical protein
VQDILFRLESLKEAGHEVNILWYYEQDDEDMYDIGLNSRKTSISLLK